MIFEFLILEKAKISQQDQIGLMVSNF